MLFRRRTWARPRSGQARNYQPFKAFTGETAAASGVQHGVVKRGRDTREGAHIMSAKKPAAQSTQVTVNDLAPKDEATVKGGDKATKPAASQQDYLKITLKDVIISS